MVSDQSQAHRTPISANRVRRILELVLVHPSLARPPPIHFPDLERRRLSVREVSDPKFFRGQAQDTERHRLRPGQARSSRQGQRDSDQERGSL